MLNRILLLVLLLGGVTAQAQESYFYFNWDVNKPLSNKEWLDNTSTRGAKLGFRKFVGQDRQIAVGADLNWSFFQEYKPTETFQKPGGAITTDYFNDLFVAAITAQGQYHFSVGDSEHIFPYVGIGLGASRNEYTVSYNVYKDMETSWGFIARPEAGILLRPGMFRKLGITAAVHYDYSTARSSAYNYSNFTTVGFQLGLMLMKF